MVEADDQFVALRPVDTCNACDMESYLYLWILNFLYLGLWSTVRVSITVNANAKLEKLQKRRGQDSGKRNTCFPPKIRWEKWKNKSLLLEERTGQREEENMNKRRLRSLSRTSLRAAVMRSTVVENHTACGCQCFPPQSLVATRKLKRG